MNGELRRFYRKPEEGETQTKNNNRKKNNDPSNNQSNKIGKGYARDHGTIDIYINASTGQVICAVSGADDNPTRFLQENADFKISKDTLWLPEELYKNFIPENNKILELVQKYQKYTGTEYKYPPGNCAEASAEALRMYLGFESNGWEHHTVHVDVKNNTVTVKEQEMCDFCKAVFLTGEKLKEFHEEMKRKVEPYEKQRGAYNPREGCPK